MKKRFLPISLLLVIMFLGQSVMADQGGHYVPRVKEASSPEAYMASLRVNQHTGMIDPAWMIAAMRQDETVMREDNYDTVYWLSMGPDNMGGRTTSIVYNDNNMNEVYIGSMGGGVYYTWNLGISWHQVGDNLMVSTMAQASDGTIYVGTGDGFAGATYNGLADEGYTNSFVGTGMYTIKNNVMNHIASTDPVNDESWAYINEVAVDGNTIIAATSGGLRYSNDQGQTWAFANSGDEILNGNATAVKVITGGKIVAAIEKKLYMGSVDDLECYSANSAQVVNDSIVKIETAGALLEVAAAPSDPKVIYAALIGNNGNHSKIYVTHDGGARWFVALPTVGNNFGHQVFGGTGLLNHGLVVAPGNPDCLYVTGSNLWRLDRPQTTPDGYYLAVMLSEGGAATSNHSSLYLHAGVNSIAFDPRYPNQAYVATDGGIFKATGVAGTPYFNYENCNRGYTTSRCFNVAPTSNGTRVVAGLLDHGPILISGVEGTNNMGTAVPLLPYNDPTYYGVWDESYHAGSCAVSKINPDAFFLTNKDGGIQRTETAGADYDFANFTANSDDDLSSFSFSGYRMPIALWETFTDNDPIDTVWFKATDTVPAGEKVLCYSNNNDFPFYHTLTAMLPAGDSIPVMDPITAKLYVADSKALYFTRESLRFSDLPYWHNIVSVPSPATCVAISNDGDVAYVGMRNGKIIRVSNLNDINEDGSLANPQVNDSINLPVTGQCITSISISNDDKGVVITLGNYGNDVYVLYCADATAADPTFVSKQGNLGKMPVYSSVIDMTTGHVLIGTEHGVYRNTNIAGSGQWVAVMDNMGDVPVMELKQQTLTHETIMVPAFVNDQVVMLPFEGPTNQGIIYAATYGRGLFRCETYFVKKWQYADVPETPAVAETTISMYPNPVRNEATVSFELGNASDVNYQVFDITGRMVMSQSMGNFVQGKHEVKISVSDLASGAYVLRVNAGAKSNTIKFMVF